ncbi:MAG: Gldg family protein [Myxococcota bacterium]
MTRELAVIGFVALASALASYYFTDHFGWFGTANAVIGALALAIAATRSARQVRGVAGADSRRVIGRGLLIILGAGVVAVSAERVAARADLEFDWTFEGAFELSPATVKVLEGLPGEVSATLYNEPNDPRRRRTALLLDRLAAVGPLRVRERSLAGHPEDADRFEIGSSNSVVLTLGDRFETVERPTEGSLFEALYRLQSVAGGVLTTLRGEGEGDLSRSDDTGYTGLAAALSTEGYALHSVLAASMTEVPEPTDVLLVIAPRRHLRPDALDAMRRYLDGGGGLVALLEPGVESGVEALLAEYGIESADAVVVDPEDGGDETDVASLDAVAHNYWDHPIARGLNRNRMTYFPGARAFSLHKIRPEDELFKVVESSQYAWLADDVSVLGRRAGTLERSGRRAGYQPLVVAGRYLRGGRETRIVAFGDADMASNKNLRTVYNLDLIVNAVHWAAENEPEITLRPKNRPAPVQFPIPLTNTLQTLHGVGLLVPELLLIAGGIVWLRRRSA